MVQELGQTDEVYHDEGKLVDHTHNDHTPFHYNIIIRSIDYMYVHLSYIVPNIYALLCVGAED